QIIHGSRSGGLESAVRIMRELCLHTRQRARPRNRRSFDFSLAGAAPALQFRMSSIAENLDRVREQIARAAANSGRSADDIELVAITQTHPAEKVHEAVEAGQTLFGESRVQEARAKIPELSSDIRWHFVGHLQKNKVRQA